MRLELTSLQRAIEALERSLHVFFTANEAYEADVRETLRAGVIQHFEIAYDQCWKFMQRWLRENGSLAEAEFPRTRKELFRMAARQGLIANPEPWFAFGDARNLTSHTYDEAQTEVALEHAKQFLPHAQALLAELEKRND